MGTSSTDDGARCEHCGHLYRVIVVMKGPDGRPWFLCPSCWSDGLPKRKAA